MRWCVWAVRCALWQVFVSRTDSANHLVRTRGHHSRRTDHPVRIKPVLIWIAAGPGAVKAKPRLKLGLFSGGPLVQALERIERASLHTSGRAVTPLLRPAHFLYDHEIHARQLLHQPIVQLSSSPAQ